MTWHGALKICRSHLTFTLSNTISFKTFGTHTFSDSFLKSTHSIRMTLYVNWWCNEYRFAVSWYTLCSSSTVIRHEYSVQLKEYNSLQRFSCTMHIQDENMIVNNFKYIYHNKWFCKVGRGNEGRKIMVLLVNVVMYLKYRKPKDCIYSMVYLNVVRNVSCTLQVL